MASSFSPYLSRHWFTAWASLAYLYADLVKSDTYIMLHISILSIFLHIQSHGLSLSLSDSKLIAFLVCIFIILLRGYTCIQYCYPVSFYTNQAKQDTLVLFYFLSVWVCLSRIYILGDFCFCLDLLGYQKYLFLQQAISFVFIEM